VSYKSPTPDLLPHSSSSCIYSDSKQAAILLDKKHNLLYIHNLIENYRTFLTNCPSMSRNGYESLKGYATVIRLIGIHTKS
jgi:hypothetical protein